MSRTGKNTKLDKKIVNSGNNIDDKFGSELLSVNNDGVDPIDVKLNVMDNSKYEVAKVFNCPVWIDLGDNTLATIASKTLVNGLDSGVPLALSLNLSMNCFVGPMIIFGLCVFLATLMLSIFCFYTKKKSVNKNERKPLVRNSKKQINENYPEGSDGIDNPSFKHANNSEMNKHSMPGSNIYNPNYNNKLNASQFGSPNMILNTNYPETGNIRNKSVVYTSNSNDRYQNIERNLNVLNPILKKPTYNVNQNNNTKPYIYTNTLSNHMIAATARNIISQHRIENFSHIKPTSVVISSNKRATQMYVHDENGNKKVRMLENTSNIENNNQVIAYHNVGHLPNHTSYNKHLHVSNSSYKNSVAYPSVKKNCEIILPKEKPEITRTKVAKNYCGLGTATDKIDRTLDKGTDTITI